MLFACAAFAQDAPKQSFDVASVKPADPSRDPFSKMPKQLQERMEAAVLSRNPGTVPMMDKSRISLRGRTLVTLICYAYGLMPDQVSGPEWISDLRFDVDAKLPDGAPASAVSEMLQGLLEDRFSLHFHRETKEGQGYALVVAKGGPKLSPPVESKPRQAPPDPVEQKQKMETQMAAMAKMRSLAGGEGGSSSTWRADSCSMAELVNHLRAAVHMPVVDATSLEGKYAVELNIHQAPDEDAASATSRALSALGLKLEPRKLARENLIVDSASKEPKEN
jgi:uncharacterized protein (TIGR03435 family)